MDKERRMLYTILGALATLAAAAAVFLTLKKRKSAEKKLIDEIDDIVSAKCDDNADSPCEKDEEASQSDDCTADEPEKTDCD